MKKRIDLHQPLLIEQQNEERFFHITANSLEVIAYSAVSPEKETPNEDCLAIIPLDGKECILAIADGAGGSRQGGDASRLAVAALEQVLRNKAPEQDIRTCVLNAYELANARIMELGVGASTTLTVIEYADGRIRPYHAGDTMIMHVGPARPHQIPDRAPLPHRLCRRGRPAGRGCRPASRRPPPGDQHPRPRGSAGGDRLLRRHGASRHHRDRQRWPV
ncbi:hypothetical protein D6C00_00190 [Thiohalobacter thiocyanaticus]|uniref:PPM-type phosphatase domain-containing protein n=1 Tax=Thiohalobacter thiocyanaticus TaxID=585455 RepID=A0A426QFN1_9GAMM|nr:hypothetical protein D6C00_00190 [Thiohalobacter thiocyanaticus]